MLTPENAQLMHVGRTWWAFDDLGLACRVTGFAVEQERAEGVLMRLGMIFRHYRERAKEEARRG